MVLVIRHTLREAINICLRSQIAYKAVRSLLFLPHSKAIKNYFGKLGSPGSIRKCFTVNRNVFGNLQVMKKLVKILAD